MSSYKDFERLVELQQLFAQSDTALDQVQVDADRALSATTDRAKQSYAAAKTLRDEAEAEIRTLVGRHPEWLDGRTIRTPYGSIEFRKSSKLEVASDEATVALIDAIYTRPGATHRPDQLVRTVREPNLEVLDTLSDDELKKVGIVRKSTESITVKRAKVELGKKGKAPRADSQAPADLAAN